MLMWQNHWSYLNHAYTRYTHENVLNWTQLFTVWTVLPDICNLTVSFPDNNSPWTPEVVVGDISSGYQSHFYCNIIVQWHRVATV